MKERTRVWEIKDKCFFFPFTSGIFNNSRPIEAVISDVGDSKFYQLPPEKHCQYDVLGSIIIIFTTLRTDVD